MTPQHFARSVANALGMRPRYINKLFATEVAGALGFKNDAHFSRSFRARYGRSPSSLR
jgi:hypothetical protein